MARLVATAGSKLYIGQAKEYAGVELVAADFNGQAWTEIKGTTDLGSAGDSAELLSSTHINDGRVRKGKGTKNAGSMAIVADLDWSDAGQLAVIAASQSQSSFAFRLVLNDAPAGGTPSERLFVGFVMSDSENYGQANTVTALNATIEVDSNFVRISAAA